MSTTITTTEPTGRRIVYYQDDRGRIHTHGTYRFGFTSRRAIRHLNKLGYNAWAGWEMTTTWEQVG